MKTLNINRIVSASQLTQRFCTAFLAFFLCFNFFSQPLKAGNDSLGIRTIVIDPGHGGKDPGCIGPAKTHEADVALAISLKFGEMVKEKYGDKIKIIYTRTEDKFVDLAERAHIANRAKADLFICIHANSGPEHAKGTETYVLGLHRSESQLKVAQRENDVIMMEDDYKSRYKGFDPKDPDTWIILNYTQSIYMKQSMSFAEKIQAYMVNTPKITDRGVKQAGFLVLHQVNMPSVLIETGFLTNTEEEKTLNDKQSQEDIAASIFKAFVDYKNEIDTKNGVKINTDENPVVKDTVLKKEEPAIADDGKIVYKVQIATSSDPLEITAENFKGLTAVEVYQHNNIYKYTYGKSNNFDEAKKLMSEARDKGYKNAFIIKFQNGKRID
ncbi:MAG: N-acetylmuramoyl-L-alanine amidase [Bacteroidota bacterium]